MVGITGMLVRNSVTLAWKSDDKGPTAAGNFAICVLFYRILGPTQLVPKNMKPIPPHCGAARFRCAMVECTQNKNWMRIGRDPGLL